MSKLIKLTESHYIIVDDSEIKEGDWLYSFDNGLIVQANRGSADTINSKSLNGRGYGKITHSTQPLDVKITDEGIHLPDWSKVKALSPKVVKELIGEVDVEKKAFQYTSTSQAHRRGFIDGYNQALEDNKEKKYTEKDLNYLLNLLTYDDLAEDEKIESCIEYIKDLLQPKTEWEVEFVDGKIKLI